MPSVTDVGFGSPQPVMESIVINEKSNGKDLEMFFICIRDQSGRIESDGI